jgi:hypothetical protein
MGSPHPVLTTFSRLAGSRAFENGDLRCLAGVGAATERGAAQVVEVDDVVASQHRGRLVTRERHHGVRVVAGVDQVLHAAPPKIMDDPTRHPDRLAGRPPRLAEVAYRLAIPVKDIRAIQAALCESPPLREDGERPTKNRLSCRLGPLA